MPPAWGQLMGACCQTSVVKDVAEALCEPLACHTESDKDFVVRSASVGGPCKRELDDLGGFVRRVVKFCSYSTFDELAMAPLPVLG